MDDRPEIIAQLFAMATAIMEDGATLAVEGQERSQPADRHIEIAGQLRAGGQAIVTLSEAILLLAIAE